MMVGERSFQVIIMSLMKLSDDSAPISLSAPTKLEHVQSRNNRRRQYMSLSKEPPLHTSNLTLRGDDGAKTEEKGLITAMPPRPCLLPPRMDAYISEHLVCTRQVAFP